MITDIQRAEALDEARHLESVYADMPAMDAIRELCLEVALARVELDSFREADVPLERP